MDKLQELIKNRREFRYAIGTDNTLSEKTRNEMLKIEQKLTDEIDALEKGKIGLEVKCNSCKEEQIIYVHQKDFEAWENGELIQKVMPYLNKYQREVLISQTCNKCWIKLFGEEE